MLSILVLERLIIPFLIKTTITANVPIAIMEIIKSIMKLILWGLGFLSTIFYFEPLGWWKQLLWSISALTYGFCKATWGIVGKIGGKPYIYVAVVAGLGLLVMGILGVS